MTKFASRLLVLFGLASLSACASLPHAPQPPAKVEFVVIGDTPYDATDEAMLATALPMIKAVDGAFVVHVGDTQSGGTMCGAPDDRLATLIDNLKPAPLVYAPGDNEWSDCDRKDDPATGKKFSELNRLEVLRKRFFAAPAITDPGFGYVQQKGFPENARFSHAGLVFVTLNVSGTNNGRDFVMGDDLTTAARAAQARDKADAAWLKKAFRQARREGAQGVVVIMQADMMHLKPEVVGIACRDAIIDDKRACDGYLPVRQVLVAQSERFGKPVFLIHGDTDPFTLTRGIGGQATANLWQLNAAGDAGTNDKGETYGVHDVTQVWIDLSAPEMLRAQGLTTGLIPASE